mgnify:CR=1 FL=1
MKKSHVVIYVYAEQHNLQRVKFDFSFHVMFCDKHNLNLDVLIFLKTYVCKHESKHKR